MKIKILLFLMLMTLLLSACSKADRTYTYETFSTKEEAIENGLTEMDKFLSTVSYKDVSIVFLKEKVPWELLFF